MLGTDGCERLYSDQWAEREPAYGGGSDWQRAGPPLLFSPSVRLALNLNPERRHF
jgi:hypothetical protein